MWSLFTGLCVDLFSKCVIHAHSSHEEHLIFKASWSRVKCSTLELLQGVTPMVYPAKSVCFLNRFNPMQDTSIKVLLTSAVTDWYLGSLWPDSSLQMFCLFRDSDSLEFLWDLLGGLGLFLDSCLIFCKPPDSASPCTTWGEWRCYGLNVSPLPTKLHVWGI